MPRAKLLGAELKTDERGIATAVRITLLRGSQVWDYTYPVLAEPEVEKRRAKAGDRYLANALEVASRIASERADS